MTIPGAVALSITVAFLPCYVRLIIMLFPILLALLAMISTLIGGYFAARSRQYIHLLMGFGAGVLLGAVFFDLLPESLLVAGEQGWSTRMVLGIVIGAFMLFYLTERFLLLHVHADDCDIEAHQ